MLLVYTKYRKWFFTFSTPTKCLDLVKLLNCRLLDVKSVDYLDGFFSAIDTIKARI